MERTGCPLCKDLDRNRFFQDDVRVYYQCTGCRLVYVPPEQFLSAEAEKNRYDLHRNSPEDAGYRAYLSRLANPMLERIKPGSRGLDFGCGPQPVLAGLFMRAGHSVVTYDIFYQKDDRVLDEQYDFITASEVAEHLRDPRQELERLWQCLRPGGILGIMTQWTVSVEAFPMWHYKNDRTHICFYSPETFSWLARKWGAEAAFPEKDVTLFLKARS